MKEWCIKVDKNSAGKIIKKLRSVSLILEECIIDHDGQFVYIPVKKDTGNCIKHDFKLKNTPENIIRSNLGLRVNNTPKFIKLGDSIIFNKNQRVNKRIAEVYCNAYHAKNAYIFTGKIKGKMRIPSIKFLCGKNEDTIIVENGVKYALNPAKVMFSPGNINIRTEMGKIDFKDKTVIDMFCGIGYFSMPVLKYGNPKRLIACDINPDSIEYFKRNLKLNRIIYEPEIFLGDSRAKCPDVSADYIIMGNFESPKFLAQALIHSHRGTLLSMHFLERRGKIKRPEEIIKNARRLGYIISVKNIKIVKSVSHELVHVNSLFQVYNCL
ncbi:MULTISPECIES: class I SAM-dependent methyltransferase family protein [Acidiplasma]|uniref:SAM-dependent methyltransferase TRM5/TYW2-type domain-containing protein n=3 Tax=Acidiplasma TaxID=507753 RepID=A0A0Q0RZ41_9ARCH|nr:MULTISPECIES: methyltransferase [Acidiplasma]KJE49428.1 hypothetical protein TZ01_05200 [Acidiplasma sp. MBA-1]KPV47481.1 hypothetical protein SE19_00885 [Acidiplasma aeolicum]KQB34517.1 hypothetical protein AOG54_04600 [Acidiplasma aeolicum]KQB35728.1 hypothetical protein AOG55_05960 [Acidiplasma cupricumulans]WMT54604.1 MAG: methyltransferase [Acidiplasma sp.]